MLGFLIAAFNDKSPMTQVSQQSYSCVITEEEAAAEAGSRWTAGGQWAVGGVGVAAGGPSWCDGPVASWSVCVCVCVCAWAVAALVCLPVSSLVSCL